jgi:hypothetical protein
MSTAFYPTGMQSYNNSVNPGNYVSWKGSGISSNPVGTASTNIRPLTNKDPGNIFPTGFGLPRPIKHYRKGRVIPIPYVNPPYNNANPNAKQPYPPVNQAIETKLINYNLNRYVKSSKGASLGGGSGGTGMISQTLDTPGSFSVKINPQDEINETIQNNIDCTTCKGAGIVANYYPNKPYLTENPETNTTTYPLCCNQERKALRRVLPTNTNLSKKYYTTLQQYRQNRCQTYEQRVFNFQTQSQYQSSINGSINGKIKPGSPLSYLNTYVANCQPNGEIDTATVIAFVNEVAAILFQQKIITQSKFTLFSKSNIITLSMFLSFINTQITNPQLNSKALQIYDQLLNTNMDIISGPINPLQCKLVVYKPNNYQYAVQGAVSASTRTLKQNVITIEKNLAGYNTAQRVGFETGLENSFNSTGQPAIPFIYKNKEQGCNQQVQTHFQNKNSCNNVSGNPTQPAFSSNHYAQSPVNPLM